MVLLRQQPYIACVYLVAVDQDLLSQLFLD